MAQVKNYTYSVGKVIAKGQEIGRVNGASLNIEYNEITAKAGSELDPWAIETVARDVNGEVTFQVFSKEALQPLFASTNVTSGYHWVQDEAITIATNVTLANSPVVSGSIIVTANNGTTTYEFSTTGGPATDSGQFTTLGLTGITFGASDSNAGEAAKVSYAYYTTNADMLRMTTTDLPDYVELFLSTVGRNTESEAKSYQVIRLPKVKFLSLNVGFANEDFTTYTARFRAAADSNGRIVEICNEDA